MTLYTRFKIPDKARRSWFSWIWRLGPSAPLIDYTPAPLRAEEVVGRSVIQCVCHAGTYGMGGPGFFAMELERDRQWLVIAIWGAGDWILVEDRLVSDSFHAQHGRPAPWIHGGVDELTPLLSAAAIERVFVGQHQLKVGFTGGISMVIDPSPARRPIYEGSGEARAFEPDDDLRRSVFLAPTLELWI